LESHMLFIDYESQIENMQEHILVNILKFRHHKHIAKGYIGF